jgi:hypothetical protein
MTVMEHKNRKTPWRKKTRGGNGGGRKYVKKKCQKEETNEMNEGEQKYKRTEANRENKNEKVSKEYKEKEEHMKEGQVCSCII